MKKRILIVDDNPQLVKSLQFRLHAAGHETLVAADGDEGLRLARECLPDLILLDVMLPKIDGFTVCRLLKYDRTYENLPIILLTARGQSKDLQIGKEIGADAYVIKPFSWDSLQILIEQLLQNE